jgi:hypothetical protein
MWNDSQYDELGWTWMKAVVTNIKIEFKIPNGYLPNYNKSSGLELNQCTQCKHFSHTLFALIRITKKKYTWWVEKRREEKRGLSRFEGTHSLIDRLCSLH